MRNRPEDAELARLIARIAAGEAAALEALYKTTSAKLFGVSLRILKDRTEAEDVLQEVYLAVWRKAEQFDARRGGVIAWLSTMTRNRAIDRLRGQGGRYAAALDHAMDIADSAPGPLALAEEAEKSAQLARCLDELEPNAAHAIRTAFFEGRTYAEIATAEGVPLTTMKARIWRALRSLRACLSR